MAKEQLDIFDKEMNPLGVCERKEVHKRGYWHRTFHCWFYQIQDGNVYVLLQKRVSNKDTFPNLLDITAAGHLEAGERPEAGIREIEEELGIRLQLEDLKRHGIIADESRDKDLIDNEFCYVYFHHFTGELSAINPDPEELSGVYRLSLEMLSILISGESSEVKIVGYEFINGKLVAIERTVSITDFVPHTSDYYKSILTGLSENQM